MAAETDRADTSSAITTVRLGGASRLKLRKIVASQQTTTINIVREIEEIAVERSKHSWLNILNMGEESSYGGRLPNGKQLEG